MFFVREEAVVVWLKRDLRISDHPALHQANQRCLAEGEKLIILYVYEPVVIDTLDFDSRHLQFINDCLIELDEALRGKGNQLITKVGKIRKVLFEISEQVNITHLYSHEEAGHTDTFSRDIAVAEWCKSNSIVWKELPQNGVIRRLKNRDGWAQRWLKRMKKPIIPAPTTLAEPAPTLTSERIRNHQFFERFPPPLSIQKGGSTVAYQLLESFLYERGMNYTRSMSSPVTGFDECSRISAHLSWGSLSVKEAYQKCVIRNTELKALKKAAQNKTDLHEIKLWQQAIRSFSGRLRWHCHFMQKLEDLPNIHVQNFARVYDGIREGDWKEEYFHAWKNGVTGYPMIDACMRALAETGYLNFRMRAMVMSFASYHLWLDWRETGLHLARMFTDYEPGIHWSQVQMQSGTTGINTVRVYSPIKQAQEQDPDGTFIKQWVPELRNLPTAYLAEPWNTPEMEQQFAGCLIGKDYPLPIVNHKEAYRAAHELIRGLRKSDSAKSEANEIQKKHGSRRSPQQRMR